MKLNKSGVLIVLITLVTMFTGIAIIRFTTYHGIGLDPDSVVYIGTAENLLAGNGFFYFDGPLTNWPPMYPLFLAISGYFSQDISFSAAWLHGILYGLNALLFGFAFYFSTRRSLLALVMGILLFFSPHAILRIHSFAWSEPPFLTFTLILFISLGIYLEHRKWYWLVISAVSLGIVMLTRYAGLAFVPVIAFCILFFTKSPLKKRINDLFIILSISLFPLGLWLIRNSLLKDSATGREFFFHPITSKDIVTLINSLHSFYLPPFKSSWANGTELLLVIILMIFILVKIYNRFPNLLKPEANRLYWMLFGFLFSAAYVIFLIINISFFDTSSRLDHRIIFLLYLFLNISFFATIYEFSLTVGVRNARLVLLVCSLFIVRITMPSLIETARGYHTDGVGYNSVFWHQSSTLEILRDYPKTTRVYVDDPYVIRYKTGLYAISLPAKLGRMSAQPNNNFQEEMNVMCNEVNQGKALYVYLNFLKRAKQEEVLETCLPNLLFTTDDGSIYGEFKP